MSIVAYGSCTVESAQFDHIDPDYIKPMITVTVDFHSVSKSDVQNVIKFSG